MRIFLWQKEYFKNSAIKRFEILSGYDIICHMGKQKRKGPEGLLLFIVTFLFIEVFVAFLIGILGIIFRRDNKELLLCLCVVLAVYLLICAVLIVKGNRIGKVLYILYCVLNIVLGIVSVAVFISKKEYSYIAKDVFGTIKSFLFMMYFVNSDYVRRYFYPVRLSIIAAFAKNRVIGCDGRIPWNIKADQERFKELTTGNVVIMGRKTFDEIFLKLNKPLPDRINIVLSENKKYFHEGVTVFSSLEAALNYSAEKYPQKEIFICGGQSLYENAFALSDKLFLTEVELDVKGDRFFPKFDTDEFTLEQTEQHKEGDISFKYLTYRRKICEM